MILEKTDLRQQIPVKLFDNVEFIFKHVVQKSDGWIIRSLKMADSKVFLCTLKWNALNPGKGTLGF